MSAHWYLFVSDRKRISEEGVVALADSIWFPITKGSNAVRPLQSHYNDCRQSTRKTMFNDQIIFAFPFNWIHFFVLLFLFMSIRCDSIARFVMIITVLLLLCHSCAWTQQYCPLNQWTSVRQTNHQPTTVSLLIIRIRWVTTPFMHLRHPSIGTHTTWIGESTQRIFVDCDQCVHKSQ